MKETQWALIGERDEGIYHVAATGVRSSLERMRLHLVYPTWIVNVGHISTSLTSSSTPKVSWSGSSLVVRMTGPSRMAS